jgi:hypothetical protein
LEETGVEFRSSESLLVFYEYNLAHLKIKYSVVMFIVITSFPRALALTADGHFE